MQLVYKKPTKEISKYSQFNSSDLVSAFAAGSYTEASTAIISRIAAAVEWIRENAGKTKAVDTK